MTILQKNNKINIIKDGQEIISKDIKIKFQKELFDYCLLGKQNGDTKYITDFVGIISKRDEILLSIPKHYVQTSDEIDVKRILSLLCKYCFSTGLNDLDGSFTNMPFHSYMFICDYYNRYGLYKETNDEYSFSYASNIHWKKTLNKSEKFISNGNIVFMPFVVKKNVYYEDLISESMKYIINDGYEQIGKFLDINISLDDTVIDIENNLELIIDKLYDLKKKTFKDNKLKLLDNIIKYLEWKNENCEETLFITHNFSKVWEDMLKDYLNNSFIGIDSNTNKLLFGKDSRSFRFSTQKCYKYGDWNTIYDYYYENGSDIYLFDAKYFNFVNDLNYKQVVYDYATRYRIKDKNKNIYNYLILPSEKEKVDTHVDRSNEDNVKIYEMYLSMNNVINELIN